MSTRESLAAYLGGSGASLLTEVAAPAAGANWEYTPTVANGLPFLYVVRSVRFTFLASAVAANRTIRLGLASTQDILVANSEIFAGQFTLTITANQSTTLCAAPGLNALATAGRSTMSIPQVRQRQSTLAGFGGIRTSTLGMDPGDQYSAIFILVEFWDIDADPGD